MGQKAGEKWTAEAVSQPTIPKSDRLLERKPMPDVGWRPAQRSGKPMAWLQSNAALETKLGVFFVLTLFAALFILEMVGVTFHAWRLGNERRDVALLGVFSGLCGVGTAVAALL